MNQDFTKKKATVVSKKKNSWREFHLKKNSCTSSEQKQQQKSYRLKIPLPPPSHHFFNGPSLRIRVGLALGLSLEPGPEVTLVIRRGDLGDLETPKA